MKSKFSKNKKSFHPVIEPLEDRLVLDSTVVFNEIMYHPAGDETQEWIELHNQMAIDMDISRWSISQGVQYTFPNNTVIPAGGYLVVAANPTTLEANTGLQGVLGPFDSGTLSNSGETITLINNSNRVMNQLDYSDSGQWPVGPDGSGTSLSKLDPLTATAAAENWASSSEIGGTPGALNFIQFDPNISISIPLVEEGDTVSVLIPSDNSLLDTWTGVDENTFIEGIQWNNTATTGVGFDESIGGGTPADTTALVSYWNFDEAASGTTFALDQQDGNNGIFGGTATRIPGLIGSGALSMNNAVGSTVNVGSGTGNNFSFSTGITVEALIKPQWSGGFLDYDEIFRKEDGGNRILFSFQNDPNNPGANPSVAAGPVLSFGLNVNGYGELDMPLDGVAGRPTLAELTDGNIHHVLATYDSTTGVKAIWIDGTMRHSVNLGIGSLIASGGGAAGHIGSTNGGENFTGVIDEVAIWGRALTQTDIQSHYANVLLGNSYFSTGDITLDNEISTDIATEMHNINSSAYVRIPFQVPADKVLDTLTLNMKYDDGFVAYLNGVEVARRNFTGTPSFDSTADSSRDNADVIQPETIDLTSFINLITPGDNILAIRGMNHTAADDDFLILPELQAVGHQIVPSQINVLLNEVAPATDTNFWFELVNDGDTPVDLENFVVAVQNGIGQQEYSLPAQTLNPGDFLVVNETELGFDAQDSNRLYLYNPGKTVLIDARQVTNRLRGRSTSHDGQWLYPDQSTPGSANTFDFNNDIVINEIFYHAPDNLEIAPTQQTSTLVQSTDVWNYDQTAAGLDGLIPAWFDETFDDSSWLSGGAPLGAGPAAADYATTILADGPVAYWRLGDAANPAVDATGHGHDGVFTAGVILGESSLVSDPANDAIRISGSERVVTGGFEKFGTGFSVEFWVTPQSIPTGFINLVGDAALGGDFSLMVYAGAGGFIRPHVQTSTGVFSIDSVETMQVGNTYHIVSTWDQSSGDLKLYINGAEAVVTVSAGSNPTTGTAINTNNPIFIGQDNRSAVLPSMIVDEVAIYDKALTAGQVANHFTPGGTINNTTLTLGPNTHYFRKDFQFNGNIANTELLLNTTIDDGAVFYLNGVEIYRQNMPAGAVDHTTFASSTVTSATVTSQIPIPVAQLINGTNTLAVEVHQAVALDDDVTFSAELIAVESIGASTPFSANNEEWIEILNRGTQQIDLTGWSFNDAVSYDFPLGTTIDPGEYLVIANDSVALSQKYPAITVVGEYSGKLSNSNERILLRDAAKNPADEVHYFDGGRWASTADGGGTSLELKNPEVDNSIAEAWAASDTSNNSQWQTITYQGIAQNGLNDPTLYQEFILGLLDSGEVLIDDISVVQNPDGAAISLLQNGDFESGNTNAWRIIGNQHGEVIIDPTNAANKVLLLTATGATEHKHNHAETTLASGATIQDGQVYEISLRVKWISGSRLLNTRLYFNRLARTTVLDDLQMYGTPGTVNSSAQANIGPLYDDLQHGPVSPTSADSVIVSVAASDADGIKTMILFYSTGGNFNPVPMTLLSDGRYQGVIPAQSSGSIVQFYIQGQDNLDATSTFPAEGENSRALYKVSDAAPTNTTLHTFDIIMTTADQALLGLNTNLMSNDRLGATVVYEGRVYYDVGVRLKGSQRGRPDPNRRGFSVAFAPHDLFRGVHDSVNIDRSGGWKYGTTFGQDEIVIHQFFNAAGNVPSMYNDLAFVSAPGVADGTALLQLARFEDIYLDSQFENGSDGALYNLELIYAPTTTTGGPEGLKLPNPDTVSAVPIRDLGDDKEAYRWHFETRNNRAKDDYDPIIALAQAFSKTGTEFLDEIETVIDVDQWLRSFAAGTLAAPGDNYITNSIWHNARFYQRPEDGKILFFPWDLDFAFTGATTSPLVANADLVKLLQSTTNNHHFLGNIEDIVSTSFNASYMTDWVDYYNALLPNINFASLSSFINDRANFALSQLPASTDFQISTVPSTITTLLASDAPATALVPSVANGGDLLGTTWTTTSFTDLTWDSGLTGVGYEDVAADYAGLINLDVGSMFDTNGSAFIRIPFDAGADPAQFDNLTLKMKYDDGFVAYLNGIEVVSANAPGRNAQPGVLAWDSLATQPHADTAAVVFQNFDLTAHLGLLQPGANNVLAIHALNQALDSSDLLILPELIATEVPAGATDIEVSGTSITLNGQGWVNVKEIIIDGQTNPLEVTWDTTTTWHADVDLQPGLNAMTFTAYDFQGNPISTPFPTSLNITSTVDRPVIDHLRISEIMYHPVEPSSGEILAGFTDQDDFEFIELFNTDTAAINLEGVVISDAIDFTFTAASAVTSLLPQQRVVLVSNMAAFQERYGNSITIAGQYTKNLSNGGEHIRMTDQFDGQVLDFTYQDKFSEGWYGETDGEGFSLVVINTEGDYNDPANWQSSGFIDGSPGAINLTPLSADFNGDGTVDSLDLAILLKNYGTTLNADRSIGDADHSGTVSLQDLLQVKKQFNSTISAPPPAAAAAALIITIDSEIVHSGIKTVRSSPNQVSAIDRALEIVVDENTFDNLHHHSRDIAANIPKSVPVRKFAPQREHIVIDDLFSSVTSRTTNPIRNNLIRASRGKRVKRVAFEFGNEL